MSFIRTLIYGPGSDAAVEQRSDVGDPPPNDLSVAFAQAIEGWSQEKDYSIPSIFRGAQILADTVASLPMQRTVAGKVTPDVPVLLETPNPSETYHDTQSGTVMSLIFDGNCYLIPTHWDAHGFVESVVVADPSEVVVQWDKSRTFREYWWRGDYRVEGVDIFHIAINRFPGQAKGIGPITACRLMLDGVKAEGNFARRIMTDDAVPPGVLVMPERMSPDEAVSTAEAFEETHQGRKRIAVLGGGADFKVLGINPVDAQFLETRNFSVQEMGRMLGIPGFFLGVSGGDSLTYATTESSFRLFINSTLNPTYLERIQGTYSRMLPRRESARFDTLELLRPDLAARYAAAQVGLDAGFLTVNEVRASEGLEPIDGGDVPQRFDNGGTSSRVPTVKVAQ